MLIVIISGITDIGLKSLLYLTDLNLNFNDNITNEGIKGVYLTLLL